MKQGPLVITHPHGGINRREEKLNPKFIGKAFGQFRIRFHQERKGFPVAKFVVAPLAKPFENRMKPQFRVLF